MSAFDLDAYLARIAGGSGPLGPLSTIDDIASMMRAHMAAIPFENLDVLLGRGVRVDLESVTAKLVTARRGDVVKLGEPYHFGEQTRLIEMPISWSLDDYPHFEFVRTQTTILAGMQPARAVLQNWFDEFLYMKKTVDWGVLTYTMHPYVIGRGYRMLALEDMVDRLTKEGATFMTMEDAAREAEKRLPPAKH